MDALGSTGSSSNGRMRMFGLASGMDIDSMVDQLMNAEKQPLIKLQQQKQQLEWQRDDYRDMNSALLELRQMSFNMSLQSTYLTRSASSSNESLVTATTSNSGLKTNYNLTAGTMAKAATASSTDSIGTAAIDPTKSLLMNSSSLNLPTTTATETVSLDTDGTATLSHKFIDQSGITINATTDSGDISFNSNNIFFDKESYDAYSGGDKVLVDANTGKLTFSSDKNITNITAIYNYVGELSATINTPDENGQLKEHTFTFTADQSINDILNTINKSDAEVTAFYGNGNQKISITSTKTGDFVEGNDITFSGNLLTDIFKLPAGADGTDASLTVNGVQVTSHTNSITVNNTTFNVKGDFDSQTVNINITDDSDQTFDKIKEWVDKYNEVIKKINDKVDEPKYRDYLPLTNEQQDEMSDNEIELWTDKAKSGMLSQDTILPSGLNQMRLDIYQTVGTTSSSGGFNQLAQIGITTSSAYLDHGKLEIDETKLKQAIADNPEAVMDLFTHASDNYADQGIMKRLTTTLDNTMDKVKAQAGSGSSINNQFSIGKMLDDYDDRIDSFQDRLDQVQERYYSQFTAMEQAINQANQQSAYLMNSLG